MIRQIHRLPNLHFSLADLTQTKPDEFGQFDVVLMFSPRCWLLLKRLDFSRGQLVPPPPGACEQLASGKRIMVAAYV